MSEMTAEVPSAEPQPVASEPQTWREEFEQQWLQVRLAHEAIMLDKMQKTIARGERLANFAATGNASSLTAPAEGEDVGVSLGNKITNNYYNTEQTATATQPAAPPNATNPAAPVPSAGSAVAAGWLKPAAIVGASLLTGVGGATAVNLLWPDQPAQVIQQGDTDTDTNAGLRFKQ